MVKAKPPPGFALVKGKCIKKLGSGGWVHKRFNEYHAYSREGKFLGYTPRLVAAEVMASNGYVNNLGIDDANDLSLWVAWNDGVAAGELRLLLTGGKLRRRDQPAERWRRSRT